ncbi:hypothetical protein BsWGS_29156 [Bradybaena similaris]
MLRNYVYNVIVLCALVTTPRRCTFAFQTSSLGSHIHWMEDESESLESDYIACGEQELRSRPGLYTYVSHGGKDLCSLYLAAPLDRVLELEFTILDVDCNSGADVGVFDGWELDDQIFPSSKDHTDPLPSRYVSLCHRSSPATNSRYLSKQNIAQVQFIVPTVGQGFRIKVNFKVNYQPCNMMLLSNHYQKITLRNYGLQRNCTVLSLYPQAVQILYMNIGETNRDGLFLPLRPEHSSGIKTLCRNHVGGEDILELYEGTGVASESWKLVIGICGVRQTVEPTLIKLRCQSSAVRLQSSGEYFNVITFAYLPGENDEDTACYQ